MRVVKILFASLFFAGTALGQVKDVPPPPKPVDNGPSLQVTMKFIQDKMNEQGDVGYVLTLNNNSDFHVRVVYAMSDVTADSTTCALHVNEKRKLEMDPGGRTGENSQSSTVPLKDIVSITVESEQDAMNRAAADSAHPENVTTCTPVTYDLTLKAAKKDAFAVHTVSSSASKAKKHHVKDESANEPVPGTEKVDDKSVQEKRFIFRDEETADRVAKAITHAVELCGGGSAPEPF